MKSKRILYLGLGLTLVWLLVITFLRANLQTPIRLFSDEYDRYIYFERGVWIENHQVPYRDVLSEYPQVPTYMFGLVRLTAAGEKDPYIAYWKFSSIFSFLMLVLLAATIELLHGMLPVHKSWAYLLLLPAPLFFAFNRFDILPAYITLLSYKMVLDRKWGFSALLLGIGAMTKWYPALLLPVNLMYYYRTYRRIPWRMMIVFGVTCLLILLPTFLFGGLDAVLAPYRFHLERGLETVSLPTLISRAVNAVSGVAVNPKFYSWTFFLLQIVAVPIALLAGVDNKRKLLNWYILIIGGFVLFSRIYSPQWMLWIFLFYILAADKKIDLVIIIFYGIVTYVGFPVVWDYFGQDSAQMAAMGLLNILMLTLIMLTTFLGLQKAKSDPVALESTP